MAAGSLNRLKISVIGFFGYLLLKAIHSTLRWSIIGLENHNWTEESPRILTFWHGHQLLMPRVYLNFFKRRTSHPIFVLISEHGDGRLVAKAMDLMGIKSVPGSSTRGGREAFFRLIDLISEGSHIAVTPDGPKGPRHELKEGVIKLAQRSGAPILPVAAFAQKSWTFKSWDKMVLPKPFSKAVLLAGPEITVPRRLTSAEVEGYRLKVQEELNQLTRKAAEFPSTA
jgi:lysophospholipid acyltransferase (LPLAT)-like uncharacterized protein